MSIPYLKRLNLIYAIIAYLFMILGYIYFILINKNNQQKYLLKSFLFGVYAFTLSSFLPNLNGIYQL